MPTYNQATVNQSKKHALENSQREQSITHRNNYSNDCLCLPRNKGGQKTSKTL